jgi:hypothetical protein
MHQSEQYQVTLFMLHSKIVEMHLNLITFAASTYLEQK